MKFIPEIKRTGVKKAFYGQKPLELFRTLLTDPRAETLMKTGYQKLLKRLMDSDWKKIDNYYVPFTLYNIGIEEVRGQHGNKPYRGLLYAALDADGKKAEVKPLKSSIFGKAVGFDALEKQMERAGAKIEKDKSRENLRHRVAEAFLDAPTESQLRENLRTSHIDLYLRRNDTGRITGVTFIDHEGRCVLNGSRLGKEYSANALNERYPEPMKKSGADLHTLSGEAEARQIDTAKKYDKKGKRRGRQI